MANGRNQQEMYNGTNAPAIDLRELVLLKRMLLFTHEDEKYLQMAGGILSTQTAALLNTWHEYILANDYLTHYFTQGGQQDLNYIKDLQPQFESWLNSLCFPPQNEKWLKYEQLINNHYADKSITQFDMTSIPVVFFRYLVTFIYPATASVRTFLSNKEQEPALLDKMQQAWFKAVCLSVILWCYPEAQPAN
jgi:hypothetical protein